MDENTTAAPIEPAPAFYPERATSPAEWAEDANSLLLTYSSDPDVVLTFIRATGVLGGHYVAGVGRFYVLGENGWLIELTDGPRFRAVYGADRADYVFV